MREPATSEVPVLESTMAYREVGSGPAILLIHGNPTSSYLWRHVLRHASLPGATGFRWIAVDLIGMGASGKPDLTYRLLDHLRYVDAFIDALKLSDVILVGHDWGVTIALDVFRRRPETIRAVAFMEAHLRPLRDWDAFDEGGRDLFQRLRTPGVGEQMALVDNFFLDTLLPAALSGSVGPEELEDYRRPYVDAASRKPLLQWAREIPVAGLPADVDELMTSAVEHLASTAAPTLLVHGSPGVLMTASTVGWCASRLRNLTVRDVGGPAGHFLPEDRPDEVADAIISWVRRIA